MSIRTLPGGLPVIGHVPRLWRDPLRTLCSLAEVGRVVRVDLGSRSVYFLTDPTDVHELLVKHGDSTVKGRLFERARGLVGVGLTTSDGELHRRQRALLQPLFSRGRMDGYAEIMGRCAAHMATAWRHGERIELDRAMYALAVATVTTAMFGSAATAPVVARVCELLPQVADGLFARTLLPRALTRLPSRFDRTVAALRALVDGVIADGGGELLSVLRGGGMSDTQLRDEVVTIMMSGTETTAVTLSWAFYELAGRPDIAHRLHDEIDSEIGNGPVSPAEVDRLSYTGCYLNEIMRLHAVPVVMRRAAVPLDLAGHHFPASTEISYSPYGLHRDPRLFTQPERLDPGRWTTDAPRLPNRGYLPFGAGRRMCIGHTFARMELVIALAAIAARWRLEPMGPAPREVMSASVPRPDALPMRVHARSLPTREENAG